MGRGGRGRAEIEREGLGIGGIFKVFDAGLGLEAEFLEGEVGGGLDLDVAIACEQVDIEFVEFVEFGMVGAGDGSGEGEGLDAGKGDFLEVAQVFEQQAIALGVGEAEAFDEEVAFKGLAGGEDAKEN